MKPKNKTGKEKKVTDLHYAKKVLKSLGKKLSQIIIYVSCEETICREHQATLKNVAY